MEDSHDNPITSPETTETSQHSAPDVPAGQSDSQSTSETANTASRHDGKTKSIHLLAPAIAIIAWFIPGLGHLLVRRWGRALAFFVAVGGLAISGYFMRGNVFPPHSDDPFGTLGFIADACSGVFYLLSRVVEAAGPNVSRAIGDYGTRFIAAAGIVNVLAVFDAYEIALGRRR